MCWDIACCHPSAPATDSRGPAFLACRGPAVRPRDTWPVGPPEAAPTDGCRNASSPPAGSALRLRPRWLPESPRTDPGVSAHPTPPAVLPPAPPSGRVSGARALRLVSEPPPATADTGGAGLYAKPVFSGRPGPPRCPLQARRSEPQPGGRAGRGQPTPACWELRCARVVCKDPEQSREGAARPRGGDE